jgi:hypothetical protein
MGDYNRHSGDEDEDDDEERSGPMLGFLFGNVDVSGDLDEEYLDQVCACVCAPLSLSVLCSCSQTLFFFSFSSHSFVLLL